MTVIPIEAVENELSLKGGFSVQSFRNQVPAISSVLHIDIYINNH